MNESEVSAYTRTIAFGTILLEEDVNLFGLSLSRSLSLFSLSLSVSLFSLECSADLRERYRL